MPSFFDFDAILGLRDSFVCRKRPSERDKMNLCRPRHWKSFIMIEFLSHRALELYIHINFVLADKVSLLRAIRLDHIFFFIQVIFMYFSTKVVNLIHAIFFFYTSTLPTTKVEETWNPRDRHGNIPTSPLSHKVAYAVWSSFARRVLLAHKTCSLEKEFLAHLERLQTLHGRAKEGGMGRREEEEEQRIRLEFEWGAARKKDASRGVKWLR